MSLFLKGLQNLIIKKMNKESFLLLLIIVLEMSIKINAQEVFGRFEINNKVFYGKVVDDIIYSMTAEPWNNSQLTGEKINIKDVKILCPSEPKIILGLGGSYQDAWKDKKPYNSVRWFLKPPSAAASPNDIVYIPDAVDAIKVEVELTIVIGKTIKNATEQEAQDAIFGYTIGNDIVGWTDSYHKKEEEPKDQKESLLGPGLKIGDRFAPFGPFIYTNFDWKNRERKMVITDNSGKELVNTSHNTSKLAYSPAKIISDLSKVLTLSPGDIVMTGTNKSYVVTDGDTVKISIDGLGTLINVIKK